MGAGNGLFVSGSGVSRSAGLNGSSAARCSCSLAGRGAEVTGFGAGVTCLGAEVTGSAAGQFSLGADLRSLTTEGVLTYVQLPGTVFAKTHAF